MLNWFTSFGYFDNDANRRVLREFRRVLREFRRVLRPGGRLLLETIHRDVFVRTFTPAPFARVTTAGADGRDVQIDSSTFPRDPETGRAGRGLSGQGRGSGLVWRRLVRRRRRLRRLLLRRRRRPRYSFGGKGPIIALCCPYVPLAGTAGVWPAAG